MEAIHRLKNIASQLGCPRNQIENFLAAGYVPQPKQLEFHAAARACDKPSGPDEIGFGGARGPGKSHAILAQVALDDCRRFPGLKALYLRKIGKQAREQFEDLRRRVLKHVQHRYNRNVGLVHLWNDSRIFIGHFHNEKDIDNYLGIEYDLIAIEEATSLSLTKYRTLRDSNRSSKPNWRPRIYNSTNPGNIGHTWYKKRFVEPARNHTERWTRFIPATVDDNTFIDNDYKRKLEENTGWKRRAYRFGDWDIAAGQYFSTFDYSTHTVDPFPIPADWPIWVGMDYGHIHPTVMIILTRDGDGNIYAIAEHAASRKLPNYHTERMKTLAAQLSLEFGRFCPFVAGSDVFIKRPKADMPQGESIADQYIMLDITLLPANTDRINGAGKILQLLGDPEQGIPPRLFIFRTCTRLIEQLPAMIHDEHRIEDVKKVDVDEDGQGGDDAYDALRYGIMVDIFGAPSSVHEAKDPLEDYDQGEF